MKFDIMTLFPDMVRTVLSESIIGRAQEAGTITVNCHNIRDFSTNKHRNTDDTPYGGGMGMVMTCQPIYDCFQSINKDFSEDERVRVIYMSPRGRIFHHEIAKELSQYDRLVFLCGHYEGVDQRILDEIVDEEKAKQISVSREDVARTLLERAEEEDSEAADAETESEDSTEQSDEAENA